MEKTILITGCSTGIGHVCALGLKARGWRVFATARNPEDVAMLEGKGLEACVLDYRDKGSIHETFKFVMERTGGRLNVLFNNGAYGQLGAVEDIKTEHLREQFEANFFGWHELTRLVIPVMRQQNSGRIIQCSSVLGIVSGKHRAAYSATKHAIEAFCASMRIELKPWNIETISIRPGPIDTQFLPTALRVLQERIDLDNSAHESEYRESLNRLKKGPQSSAFKLPPEAVLKKLIHACEASKPRPVYSVTTLTYIADMARRMLPTRVLDELVKRGG